MDLVFIYISELYNFNVIMQEKKKSTARTIKIQWYSCDKSRITYDDDDDDDDDVYLLYIILEGGNEFTQ